MVASILPLPLPLLIYDFPLKRHLPLLKSAFLPLKIRLAAMRTAGTIHNVLNEIKQSAWSDGVSAAASKIDVVVVVIVIGFAVPLEDGTGFFAAAGVVVDGVEAHCGFGWVEDYLSVVEEWWMVSGGFCELENERRWKADLFVPR